MRKLVLGLLGLVALAGVAFAQGAIKITSWTPAFQIVTAGPGPQSTFLLASGGTFVCTAGGTITVANTNVDAGSAIKVAIDVLLE